MKNKCIFAITILAVTVLSGCSKLNKENYDALKMGMSLDEVEAVIGGHDQCEKQLGGQVCEWGSQGGTYVKINFVANKAVTFDQEGIE